MGEAKQKKLTHAQIKADATGCVYCNKFDEFSIEHMPPKNMFQSFRPSGWEFACCYACNQGTKGADALAGMMAHIEAISENEWKVDRVMSQNFEQDINVLICRHSYAASSAKTLNDELLSFTNWFLRIM